MCDQVIREGSFGREQKKDDQLKHCWSQVLQFNGENTNPNQVLPVVYFMVRNGLFYQWCDHCSKPYELIIMPH